MGGLGVARVTCLLLLGAPAPRQRPGSPLRQPAASLCGMAPSSSRGVVGPAVMVGTPRSFAPRGRGRCVSAPARAESK